ncbi:hypothetical protein GA0116948_102316 [Chitinophaga costaii]|uniref:Uncharacterized protein n=1 Tax=Chitinophaga costaii TaxID=1335309 RepID=A0A1C4AWG4_9BACT|nr:hypothetical protein GA0116948_102316 [Chitinophaga costaii]
MCCADHICFVGGIEIISDPVKIAYHGQDAFQVIVGRKDNSEFLFFQFPVLNLNIYMIALFQLPANGVKSNVVQLYILRSPGDGGRGIHYAKAGLVGSFGVNYLSVGFLVALICSHFHLAGNNDYAIFKV